MGLIARLIRKKPESDSSGATSEKPAARGNMAYLKNGMVLTITDADGKMVMSERLSFFSEKDRRLVIERPTGVPRYPELKKGSPINIRGYNVASAFPFDMVGTVEDSTGNVLKICELSDVKHKDVRAFFRLYIAAPVTVISERDPDNPDNCHLVNISAGGVCFSSERKYSIGDKVCVHMEFQGFEPFDFHAVIIRISGDHFAVKYTDMSTRDTDRANRLLFSLQANYRKNHRNGTNMKR